MGKPLARNHRVSEFGETAKLAFPVVLTQVAQLTMMTTDLLFISRIGENSLAAAGLASRLYLVFFTFGLGLLGAIAPIAGQAFGSRNIVELRLLLRIGLWEAVLLSLPIMALVLHGGQILSALGQGPDVTRLAQEYLTGLAWGVAPALGFQVIRSVMVAINCPGAVLWIMVGATPINALLVYLLIYGKFGLPRLELFGAGVATSIVNCGTFLAAACFAKSHVPFRGSPMVTCIWRVDWRFLRQLIVIGTPISIATLVGYGFSLIAAFLVGRISTSALAAHQIAGQVGAVLFMISYGISTAAAVRVSNAVGRNDSSAVKRAGLIAIQLGVVIAAIVTSVVIAARFDIAGLFLGAVIGDAEATAWLAADLLFIASTFYITDAVATVATGALRGLKDVKVPLLFACIAYWLVGISLSYALSLNIYPGVVGVWLGMSFASTIYAGLLTLRFCLLANRFGGSSSCVP
ncbi:MATE family multidrug resistance protein [Bradyrhizobium sp. USDA 4448]